MMSYNNNNNNSDNNNSNNNDDDDDITLRKRNIDLIRHSYSTLFLTTNLAFDLSIIIIVIF